MNNQNSNPQSQNAGTGTDKELKKKADGVEDRKIDDKYRTGSDACAYSSDKQSK